MAKTAVAEEPVGYDARLVWVQAGQTVSEFVHRQYPNSAGALAMLSDRPFVQALVKLNAKRAGLVDLGIELPEHEKENRGRDKLETVRAYQSARLVKNTAIWVPSDAQVLAMLKAGEVTTGSQDLLKVVGNVPAHAAYAAGFLVGVPQGVYSAASDLLAGIPDAIKFLGELFAKIYQAIDTWSSRALVEDFEKLVSGLKDGADYLAKQWNQPGHFARGEFQGKVIAYVLFQIALATVAPQLAANPGKYASVFKAVAAVDKYSGALDLSLDAVKGLRKVNAAIKGGRATGATGRVSEMTGALHGAGGAAPREAAQGAFEGVVSADTPALNRESLRSPASSASHTGIATAETRAASEVSIPHGNQSLGDSAKREALYMELAPLTRTIEHALDPESYLNDVAKHYGINLRGTKIVYDPDLAPGQLGVTRAAELGPIIRIGRDALIDEATLANTIAHELSHARDYIRGGHKPHGTSDSMADGTVYGSGNALDDWSRGNR